MLRWEADEALSALIARYYGGEAGLWEEIRRAVDAELRRRGLAVTPRHMRLRRLAAGGYEVLLEDAADYANQ